MDLIKFRKSFVFAFQGFSLALKRDQNVRVHFVAALIVLILSFLFKISRMEFLIVLITIFFVIISEMINTAVEEMTNLITKEHREEARIAKDIGAAAVLLSAFFSLIVAVIIFTPYVLKLFRS